MPRIQLQSRPSQSRHHLGSIIAAATAVLLMAPVPARVEFPERPVVLVVPFTAGGPSDKIARDLADALRKPLNQSVVVENTSGAGGIIGAAKVARSAPDGYTLLVHHIGLATATALYKNPNYKLPDDFEFLGLINEAPSIVIARPDIAAKDFTELRALIAANESKLNIANAGVGSASHLCGLMLQTALKSNMTTVPYKGTAPAMTDLIGGQVDLMCEQASNAVPQIEANKAKAFAVTSTERLAVPSMARIPTLAQAGLAGFNVTVWHGLYAPKGTPAPVLAKLNAALRAALKDPELIRREEALGLTVVTDDRLSPAGHRKFVEAELTRWTLVIKASGQTAD